MPEDVCYSLVESLYSMGGWDHKNEVIEPISLYRFYDWKVMGGSPRASSRRKICIEMIITPSYSMGKYCIKSDTKNHEEDQVARFVQVARFGGGGGGGLTPCHHAVIGSEWRPRINRLEQLRPVPRVGRRPSFIQADPHLAALTVEARFQHLDHAP